MSSLFRGISGLSLTLTLLLLLPVGISSQERQNPYGEWRYQSADAWGTRYSPVNQIDASNFEDLEVAWTFQSDNYGPAQDYQLSLIHI